VTLIREGALHRLTYFCPRCQPERGPSACDGGCSAPPAVDAGVGHSVLAPSRRPSAAIGAARQRVVVTPSCGCGRPCVLKQTFKEGPNRERHFFCCGRRACKAFAWLDAQLPSCQHGRAMLRRVLKLGLNNGRHFATCPAPRGQGCNLFEWILVDEAALLEPVVHGDQRELATAAAPHQPTNLARQREPSLATMLYYGAAEEAVPAPTDRKRRGSRTPLQPANTAGPTANQRKIPRRLDGASASSGLAHGPPSGPARGPPQMPAYQSLRDGPSSGARPGHGFRSERVQDKALQSFAPDCDAAAEQPARPPGEQPRMPPIKRALQLASAFATAEPIPVVDMTNSPQRPLRAQRECIVNLDHRNESGLLGATAPVRTEDAAAIEPNGAVVDLTEA